MAGIQEHPATGKRKTAVARIRLRPGSGKVDWPSTFDALHAARYDGWLTCEAFGQGIPEVAAATKIWRKMFDSEMQLARDALSFMKAQVAQRWGRE